MRPKDPSPASAWSSSCLDAAWTRGLMECRRPAMVNFLIGWRRRAKERLQYHPPSSILRFAMKRPRLVSKGALSRLFQDAAEAWRRQDYQETIGLLERAHRLDPANPAVLLDLGRAYGLRYDYPSADRSLEMAVRVSPHKTETLAEAGRRCQEFGHYQMAAGYFARAVEQKVNAIEAMVTLAELYERHHRLEDALGLAERALRVHSTHP